MKFCFEGKTYSGNSASDILDALQRDSSEPAGNLRGFIRQSFDQLRDTIPQRDLQLPERLDDETLALNFLCLYDEYGKGKLFVPGE